MNIWANTVMTQKGLALQAKLIQGTVLNITRAVAGSGYVTPGLLLQQTAVTDPKQELALRPVSFPEEGTCQLTVYLDNEKLEEGYTARQVGVYAKDPDEGEILFFIGQTPNEEKGTEVPSGSESPGYNAEWTFYLKYGQADDVTVYVDPEGTVSREEMEDFVDEEFIAITNDEIDFLTGIAGGGETGGGTGGGSSGTYTMDHSQLYNRNISNQHTIEAITGLEEALAEAEGSNLGTADVATAWEEATTQIE